MHRTLVYVTVFLLATCGLVYQLLAGAVASYVLGDSIAQFSVVIGCYLSAMGVGAYASRNLEPPGRLFVDASLSAAVIGGCSSTLLLLTFPRSAFFRPVLYGVVIATGMLVGLALPLLLRVLRRQLALRELAARALAVDYAGAVVGSLVFSLLAVPRLGLARTALTFGILQALSALAATYALGPAVGPPKWLRVRAVCTVIALSALLLLSPRMASVIEDGMYPDPVIYAHKSLYQRVVVTSGRGSLQLFLDGNLQFASTDEHRYHEALVHPALVHARSRRNVLVLGGGDGLAVREILRHRDVQHVTLVDLDPAMTQLARTFEPVRRMNGGSLSNPRVRVINDDAMVWLTQGTERYDSVIVDFPDPNNFSLGKLYTTRFYHLLRARLSPGATVVVQSTSPMQARHSYWCVARTLEASGFIIRPYHTAVPSFGEWGYVLARVEPFDAPSELPQNLRFLTREVLATLFVFSPDMARVPGEINRLNNQVLVQLYDREWRRYF
ncbi:MAG: polyamine aminopropyltransferase [Deltaproteobacteria bacterium]|nr:polyamine aminopropyltransferase [Deltaproteobacteria bacterium]